MSDGVRLIVQPLARPARNDFKDAFRVYISPGNLVLLRMRAGELCRLVKVDDETGATESRCAIAWNAPRGMPDTVIQTSKMLQDQYGLKPKDRVVVTKDPDGLSDVDTVYLEEISSTTDAAPIPAADMPHWEWMLRGPLGNTEVLLVGLPFELPALHGVRRRFRIREIRSSRPHLSSHSLFRFTEASRVSLGSPGEAALGGGGSGAYTPLVVQPGSLGGLSKQIDQINLRLRDYDGLDPGVRLPAFYQNSGGILLFGPKGTGKTELLNRIKDAGWRKVLTVNASAMTRNGGFYEDSLRKTFAEALQIQPSLIAIDQLDDVAPRRSSSGGNDASMGPLLSQLIDTIRGTNVLVVATTRNPNQVDDVLRTPDRFDAEIELPVPTARARRQILLALRGADSSLTDEVLTLVAERTHGYVGGDLRSLLKLACRIALSRYLQLQSQPHAPGQVAPATGTQPGDLLMSEDDFLAAMQEIRPTAMREVFLDTPNVRWADIGGQHEVKLQLRRAVELPLKYAEDMKRLNLRPTKGVLLYGPPGCSKTMLVKALACETGLNFLAVKGAEVLSLYVGESERAVREIFRKARAASPSIIFFDEIDAIASRRGGLGDGTASHNSGVNVLTTLLNEMDGIEELKNVLVVAATNKPEVLDPALIRPGRLGKMLYIPPPDAQTRREIITNFLRKSVVADDVDIEELTVLTEGCSGAEVVGICEHAADVALNERVATGQPAIISLRQFGVALQNATKGITPAVVDGYLDWRMKSLQLA
ncbi:AAA+-type ATPase [Ascosphaera acerosa]|nr:AAA+-type ATPase [Ascosphaera acerosa]